MRVPEAKRLRIPLPPVDEQQAIGAILGAYDDLIEVNRRRVALLEAMMRGVFDEWFVSFRFPAHQDVQMVDTPDGPLPQGWRWATFDELAVEVRDGVSPTALPANTPYVGLEHIPRRSTTMTDWGRAEHVGSLKLAFQRGDVLFGKIRPYFHKVMWAAFDGVASSDAIIYRAREPRLTAMTLAVASSDGFVATSVQTSNGTKMPRANPRVLRAYKVATDDGKWARRFGSAMMPSIELAASLAAANRRLAASRDFLLPRLISGTLSVAAAERELLETA
jgi:type I restriction enzyme S subunit